MPADAGLARTARIRPMEAADVPAATALCVDVGLSGAAANLARYVAWQPRCGWVAVDDDGGGALVGTVTVLRWGDVGFVGCMTVATRLQGAGLGRRLLEHAHAETSLRTYLLEATPEGERLYAKLGYAVAGDTVNVTRARGPAVAARARATDAAQLSSALALDRAGSGLDRADMVTALLAAADTSVVLPGRAYGLAIADRVGPVVVTDEGAGRAALEALLPARTLASVPAHAETALRVLEAHGFTEARRLRRMHRGPDVPAPGVWCLASPGAG